MKKFLYIISAALLALTACTQELEQPADLSSKFPEGKVLVNVEVEFPGMDGADTRAMAQKPTIDSLYVAVFGSEGSFQNWIPAKFDQIVDYQNHTTTAKYSVYLPITDKKRHLHFIANPPKDKDGKKVIKPVFGDEDEVINAMVKTKGSTNEPEDAYWQKIEMDHIGSSSTSPTSEGYFEPDQYTQGKLAKVCLVRNYAKIKVSVKDNEPYKILDYRLMNVPTKGSVAPWNTGTQEYEPEYMKILSYAESGKTGDFYETLMKKYLGYMPDADSLDTKLPSTVVTVNDNGDYGAFMYERTMFTRASKEGSQTCFIAHIQFTQDVPIDDGQTITKGTKYYYKIAVVGPDGEYIPILRNIQYSIEISGIKEKGHTEAELENAAEWDFAGNINTGLEISSLNELSNGASMIRVNQTEYTSNGVVDGQTGEVPSYTIYWQYFPTSATASGTPVTDVGEVAASGSMEAYDVSLMMYDITKESAIDGSLDDLVLDHATLSDGTWGTIEVPIAQRGEDTKTSVIRISGRYGAGRRIFREVIINVLPETEFLNKQEQSTDATIKGTYIEADVIDGLNKVVNVHFRIPEGLGASMFPLNVTIEAKNNNLYSTSEDLPVETGTSYWSDKNNTFYFIRQIPLSEYRRIENGAYVYKQDYTCTLYTSKESGNSTDIVLADEKGFFKPCELSLTANATLYADKYEQTVSCTATSATVNITSSKLSWEITNLSGGLTEVSPRSYPASGTAEVTTPVEFKFNENTSTTEAKEYTADLVGKMDGKVVVTKPIKITQKKYVAPVVFNVSDFSRLSTNVGWNTTNSAEVPRNDITVRVTNSYRSGTNYIVSGYYSDYYSDVNQGTIVITPTNGAKITEVIVTYNNNSLTYYQQPSANPGTYAVSGTTGTWTGSTTSAITLTMGYQRTGNQWNRTYTFPQIKSISVVYE